MKFLRKRQVRQPRERGSILAFTGMALLTLVGMTVVGVDLGRLAFTATEVQTVAEVAATAYAHAAVVRTNAGVSNPWNDGGNAADALPVIQQNRIDGVQASAINVPPSNYEVGNYNFDVGGPFTPGGTPANAVRATAVATVDNYFAGIFGGSQSTVTKRAIAGLTCGDRARPIPLAIQSCQFSGFDGPDDCADLPSLTTQTVKLDNACWTDLGLGSFSIAQMLNYVCGVGGANQQTATPEVHIAQVVNVSEGAVTSACHALEDCWNAGVRKFTVPIVDCFDSSGDVECASHSSGNLPISGFASIELDAPPNCGGNPKTVTLHSFCNTAPTEGTGGNCGFGDQKVAMVE